ncbi:MAG TPA: GGDEF domain-containing protein, partial [Sulfurimonas sp. UBA10385]
ALMRIVNIQNNKEKILLPYEFLEKSIKNDLYIDILKDMVKKSLNFFSSREEKISINFLPDDLFNLIIMDELTESLKRFDSPNRVVVEISEKQCIDNFSKLLKIVKNLREIGVLISIDNFDGTYADNVHILVIKPDFIKIESTLIEKVSGSASLKNTLRNIIGFAKESGIKTVAESVEDEETFKLLKEYGVDEFQGYYFGYPIDLINKV